MRALRLAAATVVVLLGLALLAAWLLPRFLDWNDYRQTVAAIVSAGFGRPVRIGGAIHLSLLPQATLSAGDVAIADTGDGASATAGEMRLRVGLGGLLAGQVHPRELVLRGARIQLPWPLSARFLREGRPAAGLHAAFEDSTLQIGQLSVTAITGDVAVDPATGTLSANGLGTVLGRSWRLTGRLGRPGRDGSATLELSLDGQGPLVNTGGLLSGVVAEDGNLSGQVTGRGPDLSLLLPAPALPWKADGRLVAGSGLAVADDLEAQIGANLARGALALRFLPKLRLDAAMATSRLDLDAWLPHLLQGEQTALPTGLDLSAESATLAGGTLRQLRVGFDIAPDGIVLRDSSAQLPGDAELHLTGRLKQGRFDGAGQLAAPHLAQTLQWLRPQAPSLVGAIPTGVLQSAALSGTVVAERGSLALGDLAGQVDGAPITGDVALHGGSDAAIVMNVRVTAPLLDAWLPSPPTTVSDAAMATAMRQLGEAAHRLSRVRADVTIAADQPVWLGATFQRLTLGLRSGDGAITLRQAVLTAPSLTVGLAGSLGADAALSDGRLDVRLERASMLASRLPPAWQSAEPLFRGEAMLRATASGRPSALNFSATAALAGAELQSDGVLDLPGRHWTGGVAFRHPGAPRLLEALGLPGAVSWLGDGSLSLRTDVTVGGGQVALGNVDLAAGALRATGDLLLHGLAAGQLELTGSLQADTLPLPLPYARSPEPWLFAAGQGWSGRVSLRAGQILFGLSPGLEHATCTVSLDQGALHVDGLNADLSGGHLTGQLTVDAAAPPHLTATAKLAGVALLGPLLGMPIDVSAGRLDASVDLSASGYSPASLLATLGFTGQATLHDGNLNGLDLDAALAALPATPPADPAPLQTKLEAALNGGATHFDQLSLTATADHGAVTLSAIKVAIPAGQVTGDGTVDLLTRSLLAQLALQPAAPGTPAVGLRLSGTLTDPRRAPELGDLAQWLASRRG